MHNNNIGDEIEKGPYLLRQDHIKQAIHAAMQQRYGLYPVMSPTGSGKNFVARLLIMEEIAAMLEGKSHGIGPDERRLIVISIPGKDNRDSFASEIRWSLKEKLPNLSDEELDKLVVAIPKATDGFESYYEANKTGDIIPGCPFIFKVDPSSCLNKKESERKAVEKEIDRVNSLLERNWRDLCHAYEKRMKCSKFDMELAGEWAKKEERAEQTLRREVKRALAHTNTASTSLVDSAINRIWPGSRVNLDGPQVILVTPQRFRLSIDTVIDKSVSLDSQDVASKSVYIFDEIDHQKTDLLQAMIESSPSKFQPDEVVRALHEALHSKCNPLFRGDAAAWGSVLQVPSKDRAGGVKSSEAWQNSTEIAKKVTDSYVNVRASIDTVYKDLSLQYAFLSSDDYRKENPRAHMLFASDGLTIGDKRVKIHANADKERNILDLSPNTPEGDADASPTLTLAESRMRGIIDRVLSHIVLVAYMLDSAHKYDALHTHELSINQAIDAAGFHHKDWNEPHTWIRMVQNHERRISEKKDNATRDSSIYAHGVGCYEIDDNDTHPFTTHVSSTSIPYYPELTMSRIARKAPVIGMSATWNAPVVGNWNFDYLKYDCDAMPDNAEIDNLNAAIVEDTRELSSLCSKAYACKASLIDVPCELETLDVPSKSPESAIAALDALLKDMHAPGDFPIKAMVLVSRAISESGAPTKSLAFSLSRALKRTVAANIWCQGVSRETNFAALILTQQNPEASSSASAWESKLTKKLVECLVGCYLAQPQGLFSEIDGDADILFTTSSSNWDEIWAKAKSSLEAGNPAILMTTIAHGSFSKNLQYKMPSRIENAAVKLDYGYESAGPAEVDFDTIYLDSPTNRLISSIRFDEGENAGNPALEAVVEEEELCDRGEITWKEKRNNIVRLLSGGGSRLGTRHLESSRYEGARIAAQGIGRLDRAQYKMPVVNVLLDKELAATSDFGFLSDMPKTLPLEAAIKRIETENIPPSDKTPTAEEKMRRKVILANRRDRENHVNLLANVFGDSPAPAALDAYDHRRETHLIEYSPSDDALKRDPHMNHYLAKTPSPCLGYAFACDRHGDFNVTEIEFCRPGETDPEPAARRLRERCPRLRVGIVSQAAARFEELMAVPCIRIAFRELGYQTEPAPLSTRFPTAYGQHTEYMGALGEAAGKALAEDYFRRNKVKWRLRRGEPEKAERAGDYEVFRPSGEGDQGTSLGVWIDFKHYHVGRYLKYAESREFKDDSARFDRKADSVGAKMLIIANVLPDEEALKLPPKAFGDRCACIPYLVKDGAPCDDMLDILTKFIEEAINDAR